MTNKVILKVEGLSRLVAGIKFGVVHLHEGENKILETRCGWALCFMRATRVHDIRCRAPCGPHATRAVILLFPQVLAKGRERVHDRLG